MEANAAKAALQKEIEENGQSEKAQARSLGTIAGYHMDTAPYRF